MHIQGINAEMVGREPQTLKHLLQGELVAVTVDDDILWGLLHLGLDEAEKMLLVHAGRVVHVGVHLSHVVEVTMGHALKKGSRDSITPILLQREEETIFSTEGMGREIPPCR